MRLSEAGGSGLGGGGGRGGWVVSGHFVKGQCGVQSETCLRVWE